MTEFLLISRPTGIEWLFVVLYVTYWIYLFKEIVTLLSMPNKSFFYKLIWLFILLAVPILGLVAYNVLKQPELK
ncbi:hypothetical protein FPE01S_01_09610 [Flavihumibacter petaseus NBRC 106054]|uniref:Uncharacterized protein n=1 Tax=Flavihumibacter petaseus NBRC 106054 TaxID=1220578 RepID=A0A0E9MX07_9BACT|nr:hypothetical protein FPE01S_01_09610 [Flavihumibacter petaseus NBRC 106054]